MSKAQKWARKRNFSKFRLRGVAASVHAIISEGGVLTADEENILRRIMTMITVTNSQWNEQTPASKRMYVKKEVK